jgi:hypothetical protein
MELAKGTLIFPELRHEANDSAIYSEQSTLRTEPQQQLTQQNPKSALGFGKL